MRIHWAICLLLMLTTVGITWYVRTKDMNFFPEEVSAEPTVEEVQPYEQTGPPAPTPLTLDPLADSNIIAGIDHYRDYLIKPEELARLFSILSSRGKIKYAFLAGERLLEDPIRDKNEKREIAEKMISLSADITPYIFDQSETRELPLSISGIPTDQREQLATELTQLVQDSSGGLISPRLDYTSSEDPSLTITIGKSQPFTPLPENASSAQIISRLYILLVTEMNKNDVALPLWQATTAQEFKVALTRHSWAQLIPEPVTELETPESETEAVE